MCVSNSRIGRGAGFVLMGLLLLDVQALAMVDEAYQDRTGWIKKSIRTTAKVRSPSFLVSNSRHHNIDISLSDASQMGKFSSDRAIMNYADEYWNIEPCKVQGS